MIPRILHRVWCGPATMPERYEEYWAAWKRQLPGYDHITWSERDAERLGVADLVVASSSPVQKSDILRYAILGAEGGVYVDCDVMPFQWRDWGVEEGLVTCNEDGADAIRSIGFIAAPRGDPTFSRALAKIDASSLGSRPVNEETGPVLFRSCLTDERRLPTPAFYPYHYNEPFSVIFDRDLSETWGIHVWGMSWLGPDAIAGKARQWMMAGDVGAADALARSIPTQRQAQAIIEQCQRARAVRTALANAVQERRFAQAIRSGWLCGMQIGGKDGTDPALRLPGFIDAAWYLMRETPQATIWQIGAADGIVADLLRPLIVNFDANAVLVEPNPWLFDRLKENYRANTRLKFVNAAIGAAAGRATMRLIVPDEVARCGLPAWATGLSTFDPSANALGGKTVTPEMRDRLMAATQAVEVEVISVRDLLEKTGAVMPSIVVIDAEGMDAEIAASILDAGIRPAILLLEVACLTAAKIADLKLKVPAWYDWVDLGEDVALYRLDLVEGHARHAYIEEGRSALLARFRPELLLPGLVAPKQS